MQVKLSKMWQKLLASILVILLTAGNLMLIGNSAAVYATENLEAQNEKTQSENVEFGVYFKSENKEVHSLICDVKENPNIYIHIKVKAAGYLKDAEVELVNTNYALLEEKDKSEMIAEKSKKKIKLNQVSYGADEVIEEPVELKLEKEMQIADISKEGKVILSGKYVGNDGKETEIRKEVALNLTWKGTAEVKGTSKIITYNQKDGKTIIQEKISLESQKKSLPINKTEIEITVPEIEGAKPEEVKVFEEKTLMTNGKEYEIGGIKQEYDKETGKVKVEIENKENKGIVYVEENGKDEIIITYVYEGVYEEIELKTKAEYKVTNYGGEAGETKAIGNTQKLKETFGNYIDSKIEVGKINKAKMYANYNSEKKEYETEYGVLEEIAISNKNLAKEIEIEEIKEAFVDGEGKEYSTKIGEEYQTYYKEIVASKENLEGILGENGIIEIEAEDGRLLGKIDCKEEAEKGVYRVKLEGQEGRVKIKTSAPAAEGIVKLGIVKAIKGDLGYSKEETESFKEIVEEVKVTNEGIAEVIEAKQELEEAINHVKVDVNKEVIDKTEEEIEIKIELGNNKVDSVLYEEPTIIVSFPEFVEDVEITNSNILFEDELKISEVQKGTVEENKAIKVDLNGKQTKFNNIANSNGTTIVLGAKITSKQSPGEGEVAVNIGTNVATTKITSILEPIAVAPTIIVGEGEAEEENSHMIIALASLSEGKNVKPESEVEYAISVQGIFQEDLSEYYTESFKNVVVKDILPEGITYKTANIRVRNIETNEENVLNTVSYNETTRTVTWNIGNVTKKSLITLGLKVTTDVLAKNVYRKEIENCAVVTYDYKKEFTFEENTWVHEQLDGKHETSNIVKIAVAMANLSITQESDNIRQLNDVEDIVKFIININNNGGDASSELLLQMNLPQEIIPTEIQSGVGNNITSWSQSEREIRLTIPALQPGETYTFELTGLIDMDANYREEYQNVSVMALVNDRPIEWEFSVYNPDYTNPTNPTPTQTITPTPTSTQTTTPTPTSTQTNTPTPTPTSTNPLDEGYSIGGIAWIDENKDGIMQATEQIIKDVKAKLIKDNQVIKEAKTNEKGKYVFTNLSKGDYQVVFEFDGKTYKPTEYRKTGNTQINSSAVATAGKTGEAVIDVKNIEEDDLNLHIGLIKVSKFDMSLTKIVNKIIVQNEEGAKIYNFNSNLAKADISARYLNGTTVLVEYKLIIKNEGEIDGIVKSLVDYMPKDMKFSTDLNKTWTQGPDGHLYNSELKNLKIKPGETKELLLILTKTMSEDNVGLINNTAELAIVENEENALDIDSTPNNKVTKEDDMSSADVLIGIRTGEEIANILLVIVSLIIVVTGVWVINKKVL